MLLQKEEDNLPVSIYAESLQQLDGEQLHPDPSQWRCQVTGEVHTLQVTQAISIHAPECADRYHSCEETNLWLNLTDGFVSVGVMSFDEQENDEELVGH